MNAIESFLPLLIVSGLRRTIRDGVLSFAWEKITSRLGDLSHLRVMVEDASAGAFPAAWPKLGTIRQLLK